MGDEFEKIFLQIERSNDTEKYILMERGETNLEEFVKIKRKANNKLTINELWYCFHRIAKMMDILSDINVYLGDIKGENILVKNTYIYSQMLF